MSLVVAALAVTGTVLADRGGEVASIDGHPVTRDELLFHMRRVAPTVQSELRNEHRLQGAIDWTTPVGDGPPSTCSPPAHSTRSGGTRPRSSLPRSGGSPSRSTTRTYWSELADENEQRADAVARGEAVYGVTEFSAEEYYSHRLTEVTTVLKERLSADTDGPLRVNDADVRRAFDADRAAWSANATTFSYSKLVVRVPDGASPDYGARLQRRVAAAGTPGRRRSPGARRHGSRPARTTAARQVRTPTTRTSWPLLGNLAPGEISAPVMGTGQITYYELDGRTVDERAAFADYSRRIRQSLVEERFDQYLQRTIASSDIEVDADAVDAINAEDVRE